MTDKPKKESKIEVKDLPQPEKELTAEDAKKVKGGLQQIQQTLNRVNETVTNLSRSQSDAQKSVTQNQVVDSPGNINDQNAFDSTF